MPLNKNYRRVLLVLAVCYWLALTAGTLLPKSQMDQLPSGIFAIGDKLLHTLAYAIGVALLLFTFSTAARRSTKVLLIVVLSTTIWGVLLEFGQKFISGIDRGFEPADMIANAIGATTVALAYRLSKPAAS